MHNLWVKYDSQTREFKVISESDWEKKVKILLMILYDLDNRECEDFIDKYLRMIGVIVNVAYGKKRMEETDKNIKIF